MKQKIINFFRGDAEYDFLGNWYPAEFIYAGRKYVSTEQYLMEQKASLFRDQEARDEIMRLTDFDEIKAMGRKVRNYDEELWSAVRFQVIRRGIRAKFQQNRDQLSKFMETAPAVLAETTEKDKLWGIGISMDDERKTDVSKWEGQNLLGDVLMTVRRDLGLWIRNASPEGIGYRDCGTVSEEAVLNDFADMTLQEISLLPEVCEAVTTYAETAAKHSGGIFESAAAFLKWTGEERITLSESDKRIARGGSAELTCFGYQEMKQDLYDLIRFGCV